MLLLLVVCLFDFFFTAITYPSSSSSSSSLICSFVFVLMNLFRCLTVDIFHHYEWSIEDSNIIIGNINRSFLVDNKMFLNDSKLSSSSLSVNYRIKTTTIMVPLVSFLAALRILTEGIWLVKFSVRLIHQFDWFFFVSISFFLVCVFPSSTSIIKNQKKKKKLKAQICNNGEGKIVFEKVSANSFQSPITGELFSNDSQYEIVRLSYLQWSMIEIYIYH